MNAAFLLLPILLPIVGGFLIIPLAFKDDIKRNIYSEVIACLTTVLVWVTIFGAVREPVTVYSFREGFNITFRVDGLATLFAGMISIMWPVVLLYTFEYMEGEHGKNRFFAFYVATYGVTLGIAFAGNIITMYVFFEMLTLVTIPLVTHYGDHSSMYAGRVYAAYTIGGASLAFFSVIICTIYGSGAGFEYGGIMSGEFNMILIYAAFLLGFFGFGAKSAVFPLFIWLPLASVAPTPVTALLHAVAVVNAGVFAMMRFTWYVFGPDLLMGTKAQVICILVSVFTVVFAAVMAIRERHFKRRLAYSTMSNLSYMMFGIMLMTPLGFVGGMAHMVFHGIIKMTLFLCAGAFMHQTKHSYIYEINGVGKHMPVTFVCYTLSSLSLMGIPLFAGFISKWKLFTAGAEAGTVWGLIGMAGLVIAAFLCAVYTLTVAVRAFFPMGDSDRYADSDVREAGLYMLVPMVFFTAVNILFGVMSGPIMSFIERIAEGGL